MEVIKYDQNQDEEIVDLKRKIKEAENEGDNFKRARYLHDLKQKEMDRIKDKFGGQKMEEENLEGLNKKLEEASIENTALESKVEQSEDLDFDDTKSDELDKMTRSRSRGGEVTGQNKRNEYLPDLTGEQTETQSDKDHKLEEDKAHFYRETTLHELRRLLDGFKGKFSNRIPSLSEYSVVVDEVEDLLDNLSDENTLLEEVIGTRKEREKEDLDGIVNLNLEKSKWAIKSANMDENFKDLVDTMSSVYNKIQDTAREGDRLGNVDSNTEFAQLFSKYVPLERNIRETYSKLNHYSNAIQFKKKNRQTSTVAIERFNKLVLYNTETIMRLQSFVDNVNMYVESKINPAEYSEIGKQNLVGKISKLSTCLNKLLDINAVITKSMQTTNDKESGINNQYDDLPKHLGKYSQDKLGTRNPYNFMTDNML
jgi:hypothetical protein